ncbi:MAG: hypothetical protein Q7V15_12900 [Phenylobacterium sp.]|uniref:alginate O-acetyltransferase AlgX-related protein n=1 Tax=Phenylobacterium sp. TaxID=1871053 RepID=UPI00271C4B47|nr:hypothetical protein [Phenylobacterium sp.]MDO8902239.1 hypothetical protein [Phenylobacterium sp.]
MFSPRRYLILMVMAVLVVPVIAMPLVPFQTVSREENRMLASPPAWPQDAEAWRLAPRAVDAFLADHFALREAAIWVGARLERRLGVTTPAQAMAVMGEGGQMFLTEGLLRSTGQDTDPQRAGDYADFVCQVAARLAARGTVLATGLAPSPGTILTDQTPPWARPAVTPSDHDLILAALSACGAPVSDLRPALRAAADSAAMYRRFDSHWTPKGALVAYNEMAEALGRPDWRWAHEDLAWAEVRVDDGDLPRMAGMPPAIETLEIHDRTGLTPRMTRQALDAYGGPIPAFSVRSGTEGPSVVIIGDSFTADFFPSLMAERVGRLVWIHMNGCGFDWRVIEDAAPDYVLLLPAERNAMCHGVRPKGWG